MSVWAASTASEGYEGPKTPTRKQLPDVVALANRVFRGAGGDMGTEYPLLYDPSRLRQLRIFTEGERPVALVGTVLNEVSLLGCRTRIASIGSVCTNPDDRGHGLAGRLVDDAVDRATAAGASVMLISGHRSLYERRGAVAAGRFRRYAVPAHKLPTQTDGLELRAVTPEQCAPALALFEREPMRYLRDPAEYAAQIRCVRVMNRPGTTWLIEREGRPLAVFSADRPRPGNGADPLKMQIRELAGCRRSVVRALPLVAARVGAELFTIDAYDFDLDLAEALRGAARWEHMPHSGTVKLLNAERLWRDFRPLLAERLGADETKRLWVRGTFDDLPLAAMTFQLDGQTLTLDSPEDLTAALFGHPTRAPLLSAEGSLADMLKRALPLPLPMYGLNYV